MAYKVKIHLERFLSPQEFNRNLSQLKAFRVGSVSERLLERLEEHGMLKPKMRVLWPDPIARRIWLENRQGRPNIEAMHDPIEPDGARWEAGVSLWNKLQNVSISRVHRDAGHPLDDPREEHREFLFRPEEQRFQTHRERRVSVANDEHPEFFDNGNVRDFYSSWQLLQAVEASDLGIYITVNMADDETAERVRKDLFEKRLPEGPVTFLFSPIRAFRGFATHEAALDAIVWSAEEASIGLQRILRGKGGGRIRLSEDQVKSYEIVRRQAALEALERQNVNTDALIGCCAFLAERWSGWQSEARPLIADAYKIFLTAGVRLLQITTEMKFAQIAEAVGHPGGTSCLTLHEIWPDWASNQIERLVRTLRSDDLSEDQIRAFGQFIREKFQDAIFLRLESFERHAFDDVESPIDGMRSDLQGMSVAVEQAVRAMGDNRPQLAAMFLDLWKGTEVGRILKQHKTLLEKARPPEELKAEIEGLRSECNTAAIAADLILAARVRGAVHHALKIDDQFEIETMFVRVLRAAALTHAYLNPGHDVPVGIDAPEE